MDLIGANLVLAQELVLAPEQTGTLFLRINDSAAELSDNAGTLKVKIAPRGSQP